MSNCPICGSENRQRTVIRHFRDKARGHCYCGYCGGSYDSDAAELKERASLDDLDFRTAYVECPDICATGALYGDFEWSDEAALCEAIAAPAIRAIRGHCMAVEPRILDLGCGNGFTTQILRREFGSATGLDPSPANPDVRGTLETVRFDDAIFDAVVIVGNLMLHRDITATMREVRRILAPGGVVYLDFKNGRCASRILARHLAWLHSGPLVARQFANMRYGLGRQHIPMLAEGFSVISVRTAPPRLLEHANRSHWQRGLCGAAWRSLDWIDRWRGERAWVRVTLQKHVNGWTRSRERHDTKSPAGHSLPSQRQPAPS